MNIENLKKIGVIPQKATNAEVAEFKSLAKETGLNPVTNEIYLLPAGRRHYVFVGINGLRKIADNTGQFAGVSNPVFNKGSGGEFKTMSDIITSKKDPVTCTILVKKLVGTVVAEFFATVSVAEFIGTSPIWRQKRLHMICKVAEMMALRKAFGNKMSGLNIEEEFHLNRNQKGEIDLDDVKVVTPEQLFALESDIKKCKTVEELTNLKKDNIHLFKEAPLIRNTAISRFKEIQDGQKNKT